MLLAPPRCLEDATAHGVREHCLALCAAGATCLLIFAGEDAALGQSEWDALLRALPVPVGGGIFPAVLDGARTSTHGVLVVALDCPVQYALVRAPGDDSVAATAATRAALLSLEGAQAILLWVDGMARGQGHFVETVYDVLGAGPVFLGGASGNRRFESVPDVFCNEGVLMDAAVAIGLPRPFGVGVEHGNEPVAGPFLVSAAQGNRIHSLDFGPAVDVYCEAVHRLSGLRAGVDNFALLARAFPLGLERMDGSFLLREPIRTEAGDIICVGEVPEQSTLHILHGSHANVLRGVTRACRVAQKDVAQPTAVLLIDCLNRALYLDHVATGQTALVRSTLAGAGSIDLPVFGVLTLGELASHGRGSLEFHSKTVALGLIPDEPA